MKYFKYSLWIMVLSLFLIGCKTGIQSLPTSPTGDQLETQLPEETLGPSEGGAGISTSGPPVSAPDFAGRTLTIQVFGNGTVNGPDSFSCHAPQCVKSYELGAFVNLTATPDVDNTFMGWGGECSGTGPCLISMENDKLVTANFVPEIPPSSPIPKILKIIFRGPADAGSVTTSDGHIYCLTSNTDCSGVYPDPTAVSVTLNEPVANWGFAFIGWGGPCSGLHECNVVLAADVTEVIANFDIAYSLKVSIDSASTGSGVVRLNAAISSFPLPEYVCPPGCMEYYPNNSVVTMIAEPSLGSAFDIWIDGPCAGSTDTTCRFVLDYYKTVIAKFKTPTPPPVMEMKKPSIKEKVMPSIKVPGTF